VHSERKRVLRPGLLQATVVIAWMAAFGWLVRGQGDGPLLGRFIRSDYWWLVYTGIGILIALGASLVVRPPRHTGQSGLRSLLQIGILLLPLLFLPLAVNSELSSDAAEKRSLYAPRVAVSRPESPKPTMSQPKRKTQVESAKPPTAPAKSPEPTMLDLVSNPEDFEGSNVTLLGMVHRDKRLPANSFFCYRLVMVCCAADATPAGVIVEWPQSSKLKKGAWVTVHGKVTMTKFEGGDYPAISAVKVEKTKPPKNRFLIPQ
jgi:putative membrane protein